MSDDTETRKILNRPDKPPNWEPISAAQRSGISEEEIQSWLQAGKKAQQEHIDKLKADSVWVKMAECFGAYPAMKKKS